MSNSFNPPKGDHKQDVKSENKAPKHQHIDIPRPELGENAKMRVTAVPLTIKDIVDCQNYGNTLMESNMLAMSRALRIDGKECSMDYYNSLPAQLWEDLSKACLKLIDIDTRKLFQMLTPAENVKLRMEAEKEIEDETKKK